MHVHKCLASPTVSSSAGCNALKRHAFLLVPEFNLHTNCNSEPAQNFALQIPRTLQNAVLHRPRTAHWPAGTPAAAALHYCTHCEGSRRGQEPCVLGVQLYMCTLLVLSAPMTASVTGRLQHIWRSWHALLEPALFLYPWPPCPDHSWRQLAHSSCAGLVLVLLVPC